MSIAALHNDCRTAIAQIRYLTNEELDGILNDDDKIDALLKTLNQSYLKDIDSEKDTLLSNNTALAESTLAREPELVEAREKVAQLSEEGEELSNTVKEKYDQMRSQSGDMSAQTALALLQTAASEMEEESEKSAQKFLDSEMELDDFLDQFLTKRKLMHMRLIKTEKMSKLVTRDSNIANYINAPPVAVNTNYFPGVPTYPMQNSVPYPTGPLNMPMPTNYYHNHY